MPFMTAPLSLEASMEELDRTLGNGFREGGLHSALEFMRYQIIMNGAEHAAIDATTKGLLRFSSSGVIGEVRKMQGPGDFGISRALIENLIPSIVMSRMLLEEKGAIELSERTAELHENPAGTAMTLPWFNQPVKKSVALYRKALFVLSSSQVH